MGNVSSRQGPIGTGSIVSKPAELQGFNADSMDTSAKDGSESTASATSQATSSPPITQSFAEFWSPKPSPCNYDSGSSPTPSSRLEEGQVEATPDLNPEPVPDNRKRKQSSEIIIDSEINRVGEFDQPHIPPPQKRHRAQDETPLPSPTLDVASRPIILVQSGDFYLHLNTLHQCCLTTAPPHSQLNPLHLNNKHQHDQLDVQLQVAQSTRDAPSDQSDIRRRSGPTAPSHEEDDRADNLTPAGRDTSATTPNPYNVAGPTACRTSIILGDIDDRDVRVPPPEEARDAWTSRTGNRNYRFLLPTCIEDFINSSEDADSDEDYARGPSDPARVARQTLASADDPAQDALTGTASGRGSVHANDTHSFGSSLDEDNPALDTGVSIPDHVTNAQLALPRATPRNEGFYTHRLLPSTAGSGDESASPPLSPEDASACSTIAASPSQVYVTDGPRPPFPSKPSRVTNRYQPAQRSSTMARQTTHCLRVYDANPNSDFVRDHQDAAEWLTDPEKRAGLCYPYFATGLYEDSGRFRRAFPQALCIGLGRVDDHRFLFCGPPREGEAKADDSIAEDECYDAKVCGDGIREPSTPTSIHVRGLAPSALTLTLPNSPTFLTSSSPLGPDDPEGKGEDLAAPCGRSSTCFGKLLEPRRNDPSSAAAPEETFKGHEVGQIAPDEAQAKKIKNGATMSKASSIASSGSGSSDNDPLSAEGYITITPCAGQTVYGRLYAMNKPDFKAMKSQALEWDYEPKQVTVQPLQHDRDSHEVEFAHLPFPQIPLCAPLPAVTFMVDGTKYHLPWRAPDRRCGSEMEVFRLRDEERAAMKPFLVADLRKKQAVARGERAWSPERPPEFARARRDDEPAPLSIDLQPRCIDPAYIKQMNVTVACHFLARDVPQWYIEESLRAWIPYSTERVV
ncbi:hypothetical protein BJ170DRAFT_598655 [Xylariales sp. AK1849]|nr:hypothetical protein BJ170DRAFT_598655 [Xylariales sp. AK1849]